VSEPEVSFVIPVRDDAVRLRRCLASIIDETPASCIEVIVVDNGSADDSAGVARRAGATVISAPGRRVAEMRNLGAEVARGRLLAFVDADHLVGPGWVSAALSSTAEEGVAGAGSLCRAPEDGTWVQHAYDRLRGRSGGRADVDWLGAGNIAVTRRAFRQVGGFNTSLETCEDVDLCKRLRGAGYRLVSDERMVNVHLGDPATLSALFHGERWRGRNNLSVSFRPPVRLRELPSAVVPLVHLGGALLGVTAGVAWRVPGVALLALAPLALVPIARAVRMSAAAGKWDARQLLENAAVAFVYDMARACALVTFAEHSVRRR
jgi:GT2 family glycosyltransferase